MKERRSFSTVFKSLSRHFWGARVFVNTTTVSTAATPYIFQPSFEFTEVYRMSRTFDDFSHLQTLFCFRVDAAYKQKVDKVKPVDTSQTDGSGPGGSVSWREEVLKRETPTFELGVTLKFSEWLIPKFSTLARSVRLKPERLQKMIIGDGMTFAKKKLLIEMLFNCEAALA